MKEVQREEAVSEVVGTILILAITVALFATVFTYTQHIPPPSKTSQTIIYPSISLSGNHIYLNLSDRGGSTYASNETYLIVNTNGSTHSFLLYIITGKGSFGPGDNIYLNGSKFDLNISNGSSFYVLLFSKQFNSIIWQSQNFIGKSLSVLNVQVVPSPIIPSQSFTVIADVYTLSPSSTVVRLNLPSSFITSGGSSNISMNKYPTTGNIVQYYAEYTSPVSIPASAFANVTAYIPSSGIKAYDNVSLLGGVSYAPSLSIVKNGIVPEYVRPEHGSYDPISIIVQNNGPVGATFNIFIYDEYPNGTLSPIQNNYGTTKAGKEYILNQNFTVGALSSSNVNIVWLNVGGNNSTAGGNYLIVGLTNIRGQNNVNQLINPPNSTYYIYIMPKILLVNDQGATVGTQEDVGNYYTTLLQYTSYQFKEVTVNSNQNVTLSGYDVVIWFTGNNTQGLSEQQQGDLKYFYNHGGKIFLISASDSSYSLTNSQIKINSNIVVNLSKTALTNFNINQLKNTTADYYQFMNPYFVSFTNGESFTWMQNVKPFMNITYSGNIYNVGEYSAGNNGGKIVVVGFEFARLLLYQQDYIANKILMWLANINTLSGDQLVLSDIEFSKTTPLFYENETITFVITNLSPTNLTTTLEMLVDGNFYKYVNGITVPKDGGFQLVNVSWYAAPPGTNVITGIVDPFHQINQINYALDEAAGIVNTTIFVRFSTLVVYDHGNGNNRGTPGLNATMQSIGVPYSWMNFVPNSGPSKGGNLSLNFSHYNLIALDLGTNGNINSSLSYALLSYQKLKETNPSYPYSLIIMGNGTYGALTSDYGIGIASQYGIQFSSYNLQPMGQGSNEYYYFYGINTTVDNNYGFFGNNVTNGYGLVVDTSQPTNIHNVSDTLSCGYEQILSSSWNYHGLNGGPAILLNDSGFKISVLTFSISSIVGIIQSHTSQYAPSSPLLNARSLFTLMIMGYSGYTISSSIPYVMSSSISFSSPVLMINRYYLVNANISNLGSKSTIVIVQAYDGSGMFDSETVTLPGLSTIPVQFMWDPQYAALPSNPREMRIVISYSTTAVPSVFNFLREGMRGTAVYVFYDNMSTGNNWNSEATVWAYTGVNFYSPNNNPGPLYSVEPYNVEGYISNSVNILYDGNEYPNGMYQATGGSLLFKNSTSSGINYNGYWGFIPGGVSGGFSLGTSYNYVNSYNLTRSGNLSKIGSWSSGYYPLQTKNLQIHGSQYTYLQLEAQYELANGGEGVALFVSPSGSSNWSWIAPIQGYPGNVNASVFGQNNNNYMFGTTPVQSVNNAELIPAFTMTSGGQYIQWVQYTFNISQYIPLGTSSISIQLVLIIDGNYNLNIFGNDYFYADNIKVIQNGTTGLGNTLSKMWGREKVGNTNFFNSSTIVNKEIATVTSVPISFANLINATLEFQTQYSIYAWFANASNLRDTPYGFRLYVGIPSSLGQIMWVQMDTRWAGEAGKFIGFQPASQIPSAFYSKEYAFHFTGDDISLTGYIGMTVYLMFEVNGDYYNYTNPPGGFNGNTGINPEPAINSAYWADFTDVTITGTSYADLVSVNTIWT